MRKNTLFLCLKIRIIQINVVKTLFKEKEIRIRTSYNLESFA